MSAAEEGEMVFLLLFQRNFYLLIGVIAFSDCNASLLSWGILVHTKVRTNVCRWTLRTLWTFLFALSLVAAAVKKTDIFDISFPMWLHLLFSVMWLTQWLGTLIRAQVFDVNNGNEDKADLVNPNNYDLENTQNFYFRWPSIALDERKDIRIFWSTDPSTLAGSLIEWEAGSSHRWDDRRQWKEAAVPSKVCFFAITFDAYMQYTYFGTIILAVFTIYIFCPTEEMTAMVEVWELWVLAGSLPRTPYSSSSTAMPRCFSREMAFILPFL